MRIGARLTFTSVALVAVALALVAVGAVQLWTEEQVAALTSRADWLGLSLQRLLERGPMAVSATASRPRVNDLDGLVALARSVVPPLAMADGTMAVTLLPLAPDSEPLFEMGPLFGTPAMGAALGPARRRERVRRMAITETPYRELTAGHDYILTVPLRAEVAGPVGSPTLLAALEVVGRIPDLERNQRTLLARLLAAGLAVDGLLLVLLWRLARRTIGLPAEQLVDGVLDVAEGDLSRVLLAERNDELGILANCFNEMTASLRAAREETQRSVDARVALEARLRHTEKLATIGQLSASIAHEVGTPLNVIAARSRTIAKKAGEPDEVLKNAQIISEQTTRITKIIQQILDFARQRAPVRAPLQLRPIVERSMGLLDAELRARGVGVVLSIEGETPDVVGDGDQLQQVCLNLLLNGAQAMVAGGLLSVQLSAVTRQRPGLEAAKPQPLVQLEIVDHGVGIPPEERERIFEPFYSTKREGEGTGLGLSISLGIIKDHEGWLELDSEPGVGTTVRVLLPARSV